MESSFGTVRLDLQDRSYPIYIGDNILTRVGRFARDAGLAGQAVIISDTKVAELYSAPIVNALEAEGFKTSIHLVDHGESSKAFDKVEFLCESMASKGVDRYSFVIALGGGVVGDLAGFVASIYYRGIPVIQVPTTVMAQVDSSVGGKTGINLQRGKNLVGTFHQPVVVVADTVTLKTLGRREWSEGFAEVIKYGVIRDASLLTTLRSPIVSLPDLIRRCVEIKASFVEEDERETKGLRALLNFGHTLGHAIEAVAGYGALLHGEAVALGMLSAAEISRLRAGMSDDAVNEIRETIRQFGLPMRLPSGISTVRILETIFADKKFVNGRIRFVVSSGLGEAALADNITVDDLKLGLAILEPSTP
jgi:3-dehydroquinate synthase